MYLYDPEDSEEIAFSNPIRYVSLLVIISLVVVLPLFYQDLYSLCEDAAIALFP